MDRGVSFSERLEEDENKQKKERFVPISDEELNQLELFRNERTTARSTSWAVRCFQDYLKTTKQDVDFPTVTKEELNRILREFYGSARNSHGQHYSISSYVGLRAGINRYINEPPLSRAWCLMQDTEFTTSNNVFSGLIKSLRRAGHDKTEHHAAITEEDLAVLRKSEAMNPNTARGLVNKVWFDIQLHFGRRGKEGLRKLTPQSFEIKRDSKGTKYVTLSFNEETKHLKHHHDRDRPSRRGAMFEDQGNELCPVSSFEKYISKIPKEAKAFYLHPKKGEKLGDVWYSLEPMGVNYLGSMLSRLSKEAGTSVIYTNHCIRSTTIQKLPEGGHEAREVMTVSGHRSESSSLDNKKLRSNQLCADQENKRPLEVSLSTTSPAQRQRSRFNQCNFNDGGLQGEETEDSQQGETSEAAPIEDSNPPTSPTINIKDELIDEGYDAALLPQSSIRQIKEELEHQEEELRISSVFSVGGGNTFAQPTTLLDSSTQTDPPSPQASTSPTPSPKPQGETPPCNGVPARLTGRHFMGKRVTDSECKVCSQRKRKRLEEEEQDSKKPKTAEDNDPEKKVEPEVEKEEVTPPNEKKEQREEEDSDMKPCEDKSETLRTLTSYYCKTCSGEPSLCPVPCFELYHTRLIYKTAPELETQPPDLLT